MSARFVYHPFSAEQMTAIGQRVIDEAVKPRIAAALNVEDAPARGLSQHGKRSQRYYYVKKAKELPPVRDLRFTGRTMASLGVISSTANQVRVGFRDAGASRIAAMNQNRESMFWFSPQDLEKIGAIVREEQGRGKQLVTVLESGEGERIVLRRSVA